MSNIFLMELNKQIIFNFIQVLIFIQMNCEKRNEKQKTFSRTIKDRKLRIG